VCPVTAAADSPVCRAIVLRAIGPPSRTARSTALALALRRAPRVSVLCGLPARLVMASIVADGATPAQRAQDAGLTHTHMGI